MRGGRKLSAPGEYPSIPQYQKPKGYLIATAALELSTNQITHFYSKTKNTAEMIKLEILSNVVYDIRQRSGLLQCRQQILLL